MNAKKQDNKNSSKSKQLVKRKEITGTPFVAVKDEKGWFLTMGQYRITEHKEELKGLEQLLKQNNDQMNWNFLTTVIATIVEQIKTN